MNEEGSLSVPSCAQGGKLSYEFSRWLVLTAATLPNYFGSWAFIRGRNCC